MRLAILTNRFPPALDGVGDYSFQLASELHRRGHAVAVLCRCAGVIQPCPFPVVAEVPAWNSRAIRPFRRFLTDHRPDWLLVQYVPDSFQRWAMPVWLPVLVGYARRRGVRVGILFHEVSVRCRYWPPRHALVSGMQRVIARLLARQADRVVTSIDCYVRQLQGYTNRPVHPILIGSNIPPEPVSATDLSRLRHQLTVTGGPLLCTFGRRNQDLLIQVLDQLLPVVPNLSVVIIGQLAISDQLLPLYGKLAGRIHVTGYLSQTDVHRHLLASDVLLMTDSVTTGGGGGSSNKSASLAAGLAAGLPVVGTLGDTNNALLFRTPGLYLEPAADLPRLAQRLLRLLTDPAVPLLRPRIRHFFDQHLSWTALVDQYEQAFGWPQPTPYDCTPTAQSDQPPALARSGLYAWPSRAVPEDPVLRAQLSPDDWRGGKHREGPGY